MLGEGALFRVRVVCGGCGCGLSGDVYGGRQEGVVKGAARAAAPKRVTAACWARRRRPPLRSGGRRRRPAGRALRLVAGRGMHMALPGARRGAAERERSKSKNPAWRPARAQQLQRGRKAWRARAGPRGRVMHAVPALRPSRQAPRTQPPRRAAPHGTLRRDVWRRAGGVRRGRGGGGGRRAGPKASWPSAPPHATGRQVAHTDGSRGPPPRLLC
jgi:hypothetical protein